MITLPEARILHQRYDDGTLTQSELHQLAAFILSPACPDEWQAERGLFATLLAAQPASLPPAGFEARLRERMKAVTADDVASPAPRPTRRLRLRWAAALTAAAALTGALWIGLSHEGTNGTQTTAPHPIAAIETKSEPKATPSEDKAMLSEEKTLAKQAPSHTTTRPVRRHRATKAVAHQECSATEAPTDLRSTAQTPEEAEAQLRLIAQMLREASEATKLQQPVIIEMDWSAWRAATLGIELSDNRH